MKINFKEVDKTKKNIVEKVLSGYGLNKEWLTYGQEQMHDGSRLRNFEKGMDLLLGHIKKESKIGILVDTDTDGYTSSAIMYQWILDKNPNANLQYFNQEGKVHGIMLSAFKDIELDLLIVPDAGSGQIHEHKALKDRGWDLLVLDHHELQEESEYAVVINPHNEKCTYPNKNLSGGAVVYKFIEAIDRRLASIDYVKYIDLAAISIISDVMSIKSPENKAIVNIGLSNLNNPYMVAAFKADQRLLNKNINPISFAFYVVPVINATIRMGEKEDKDNLFEAICGLQRPEPVIASLLKIKGKQDRSKEPLITRICYDLAKNGRDKGKIIFAEPPANTPKSLTGLIAGQLTSAYNRPVLLGREDKERGVITGSLRSLNDSSVENLKDFCEASGLFNWVAGHQAAAGFEIPTENLEKFLAYVDDNLPPVVKEYNVALSLTEEKDAQEAIKEISILEDHLASDFKEVLIYDEFVARAGDIQLRGAKQDTLIIRNPINGMEYIKFRHKNGTSTSGFGKINFDGNEYDGGLLRIVGKPSINEFNGVETAQLVIVDLDFVPETQDIVQKYIDLL